MEIDMNEHNDLVNASKRFLGEAEEETMKIAVWADGIWCHENEIEETMTQEGKSDDFEMIEVPIMSDEEIESYVANIK